ncbi:hypothetical protein CVT24_007759 [Panaeolus cyanescens]|uniref:Uncharacterized protein n=1 Tax=Panaeolus cyanescens TaxID=181874 RepID=A0A409YKU2_9AGAR|nr:hypothetical protein CVT24_007759 [Panaeolus cyanescens]
MLWTGKRFRATVIDDILPQVLFYTVVSAVVTVISAKSPISLGVSNQLLTVLGVILGLVITFRTTSAYEKYQDGRQMWTDIMMAGKHLAQLIWIHVPVERSTSTPEENWTKVQVMTEKKTMINLILAYAVSVKHFLRGEPGIHYDDLYPYVAFLPRYADDANGAQPHDPDTRLPLFCMRDEHYQLGPVPRSPTTEFVPVLSRPEHSKNISDTTMVGEKGSVQSAVPLQKQKSDAPPTDIAISIDTESEENMDPTSIIPNIPCRDELKPACNPPAFSLLDYVPLFQCFLWLYHLAVRKPLVERKNRRRAYAGIVESDVSMQIVLVLSDYSAFLMKEHQIDQQIAGAMTNNLFILQDVVSNLERICNTPLPWAYQVHLQFSSGVYLILLPFQLYPAFGYVTIVATFFTSFLLLGFLEIGQEIENPFNYDENDLDLDGFCHSLHRDLNAITTYKSPLTDRNFFNERQVPNHSND